MGTNAIDASAVDGALAAQQLADRLGNGKAEPLKGKNPAPVGDLVVFTAINAVTRAGRMFIWDEAGRDARAIPAVGTDLNPGGSIYQASKIAFDRRSGGIYSYDLVSETISAFNDINQTGFTTRPSMAGDGKMMTFVSNPDGLPGIRPGVTRGYVWTNGVVAELPKVNAVADLRGGLARVRLAGKGGGLATFCTLDGGVFLYDLFTGNVREVTEVRSLLDGFGHHPVLSGDGKKFAFVVGRTSPQQIFVTDIRTVDTPAGPMYDLEGLPEPLAYANAVVDTPIATAPRFTGSGRIYFEAFRSDLDVFKAFRYDPVNGVQMLSILNATILDEATIYAGTGVP